MSNSDYIAETIFQILTSKEPLLEIEKEEWIDKIKIQYEKYLLVNLLILLTEEDKIAYEKLLDEHPMDKKMHNEFIIKHIPDYENEVIDLSKNFINNFINFSEKMK